MEKGPEPQPGMVPPPYPGPPLNQPQPIGFQHTGHPVYIPETVDQVVVVKQLPTDIPGEMWCPGCRKTVITEVVYKTGLCTWIMCAIIGCFMCWPLCWIPFCSNSCKDVDHSCPDCHQLLHFYKRG